MVKNIVFLAFLCCSWSIAQVESRRSQIITEHPEFYVDAISFISNDSSSARVDFYIQMPYDALQFVKTGDLFIGRYEVTVNILASDNVLQSEKVWMEEVKAQNFETTQLKNAFNLSQRSLNLPPGIYTLRAQIRDHESKKVSTVIKKIIVGNYVGKDVLLSDIMLVSRVTIDGEKQNIMPNVSGNIVENNNKFYTFFEVYSARPKDSIELHFVVTDFKGNQLLNKYQIHEMEGKKAQIITGFDSIQYQTGAYMITVEVKSLFQKDDVVPVVKQKGFVVRWNYMPINLTDLDLAIKQARYIAKENEYDVFESAKTDEEKRLHFEAFWKKRDSNPDTKRNEVMEEYYSRVEYANTHFSHYIPGWKTDMGMVFIIFGSPNNVERHPFDIDSKPYEIWSYYDYNRNIVFVDETGFGDYRLLTPIWDLIQRLKY